MAGWNTENNEATANDEAVVMLLAGPPSRVNAWFTSLQMDSRFRVNTFSTDPQDLENKMGYNPEAILLDATIFSGPENLVRFLTKTASAVYVILPREAGDDTRKSLTELPSVRGVFINDINLSQMAGRIYAEVVAMRNQAPTLAQPGKGYRTERIAGGLRVITVWSRTGGCGKSTLAAALALEAAQRGIKTLLVGLSVPEISLPTFLNLKTTPNLFGWLASPSFEGGIRPNVQSKGLLDVLVGLQDGIKEKELIARPRIRHPSTSWSSRHLRRLQHRHSDTPVSALISMPSRPAIPWSWLRRPCSIKQLSRAEAYRMAFKRMRDQHRIGVGNVFVVLNRFRSGLLTSNEWHEAAMRIPKRWASVIFRRSPKSYQEVRKWRWLPTPGVRF
jgi:hypothetical protein